MIQLKQSSQLDSYLSQKTTTPRYRPKDTAAVADQLYRKVSLFAGKKLSPESIKSLSKELATGLKHCKASAFIPMLQYFATYPLSEEFLKFFCQQAAAARYTLKKSIPFDLFRGALGFEWAPFKILAAMQDNNSYAYHIIGEFIDGRPCGMTFDLIKPKISYQFYKEAGVPRKLLKGKKLDPKDLVGFTYTALLQYVPVFPLDFTNYRIKRLDTHALAAVRCTTTQAQANKILYKERCTPCPFKIPVTCAQCFIGYDTCPRGCQPLTNWAATTNPPTEILIHGQRKAKS